MQTIIHTSSCACPGCTAAERQAASPEAARTAVESFVAAGYRWQPGQTISWAMAESSFARDDFDTLLPDSWAPVIADAFGAWAAVSTLQFEQVADGAGVDIRFGGVGNFDDPNNTLAQASTVFLGEEIQSSDILFDLAEDWVLTADGSGRVTVFATALHEIGHALGLSHEDRVQAVMNSIYDEGVQTLLPDDIAGVQAVYGPPGGPAPADPPANGAADLAVGTAGSDSVTGEIIAERIYGIQGDDSLAGGAGGDSLFGNAGDDSLLGDAGNDTLRGQIGDDVLDGGIDNDLLFGGGNADQVSGGDGNDVVNGDSGADTVAGGAGNDTVRGQGGADRLLGDDGNDTLLGHAGSDTILGGSGADRLTGGPGDDSLAGGEGVDAFVFAAVQGDDAIADFVPGLDMISLVGVAGPFQALSVVDGPVGAVFTFEATQTTRITLEGVAAAELSAGDFMFS
jgi:Ca2+-binding RTX toxin-like protein